MKPQDVPHERPLFHSRGCKTSSVALAAYLSFRGNPIVALEPVDGAAGRFFFVVENGPRIDEDLGGWQSNAPIGCLDFAREVASLNRMIAVAKKRSGQAR